MSTALNCPFEKTLLLANIATRLSRIKSVDQEKLINWGYAVSDAAMRRHVNPELIFLAKLEQGFLLDATDEQDFHFVPFKMGPWTQEVYDGMALSSTHQVCGGSR